MSGQDRTSLGIEHFNAGRFREAAVCFRDATDPTLRGFYAHALDALGRRKEAVAVLSALITDHPRIYPSYIALAGIGLRAFERKPAPGTQRALLEALKAAQSALRSAAGPEARRALAEILHAQAAAHAAAGRPTRAEFALRRAAELAAKDARIRAEHRAALLTLGLAQRAAGKFAEAEKTFRRAGATDEVAATLQARGWAAHSAGRPAQAEKHLRAALALDPARTEFLRRLDRTLRERERGFRGVDQIAALQLVAQRHCIAGRLRKRDEVLERIVTLSPERPIARFKALMNLGRYREGLAAAEAILDRGPELADVWGFANPWDWEDWATRSVRGPQIVRDLESQAGTKARSPWLHFYRGLLGDAGSLAAFDRLSAFSPKRYGWMYTMAGRTVLIEGSVTKAVALLKTAANQRPRDWRTHCLLGEAYLVLRRREEAYAEMDRAKLIVPPENEGLLLAWRGAFDLWTGEYARALELLERACELKATHAYCWKGAALFKLGRVKEALETLDLTVTLYPGDIEAYVWRGEAKRELGRYEEAIADLSRSSLGVWALANRVLAKRALGDDAGAAADYEAIPQKVRDHVGGSLEKALALARGWRREEYGQAIWLDA